MFLTFDLAILRKNWECCNLIAAKIADTFARVEEGFRIAECGLRIDGFELWMHFVLQSKI